MTRRTRKAEWRQGDAEISRSGHPRRSNLVPTLRVGTRLPNAGDSRGLRPKLRSVAATRLQLPILARESPGGLRPPLAGAALRLHWAILVPLFSAIASPAAAQRFASAPYGTPAGSSPTARLLADVGIEQHLDAQLPLDVELRDETGKSVKLGDFFGEQPVVLTLVYYKCPMLCTQVLNGFLKSSQAVPLEIGRDYQVVTVSFDPRETHELAAEKKDRYTRAYRRAGAAAGWHFLTGDKDAVDRLTATVGFRYHYDSKSDQFAHASGLVLATPEGKLARYFYGIEYSPHDLRLGLVESSAGRIGSPVEQVLLLCYHYDPLTGHYGLAIAGVLKLAGTLTVLVLGAFLVRMYRHERRRTRAEVGRMKDEGGRMKAEG
ncbi:MAG TPA: SCO family protein [Pirellulales bacterium]|nr:SCO family protein [Pirellulales bacterium]